MLKLTHLTHIARRDQYLYSLFSRGTTVLWPAMVHCRGVISITWPPRQQNFCGPVRQFDRWMMAYNLFARHLNRYADDTGPAVTLH